MRMPENATNPGLAANPWVATYDGFPLTVTYIGRQVGSAPSWRVWSQDKTLFYFAMDRQGVLEWMGHRYEVRTRCAMRDGVSVGLELACLVAGETKRQEVTTEELRTWLTDGMEAWPEGRFTNEGGLR